MACIYCGSEKIHVHEKVNASRLLWHSVFDLKELQVTCLSCGKSFKPCEKPSLLQNRLVQRVVVLTWIAFMIFLFAFSE